MDWILTRLVALKSLVLFGVACSDASGSPSFGAVGQECYPNGTCNVGLDCVRGFCVPTASSDVGTADADAGDAASTQPECDLDYVLVSRGAGQFGTRCMSSSDCEFGVCLQPGDLGNDINSDFGFCTRGCDCESSEAAEIGTDDANSLECLHPPVPDTRNHVALECDAVADCLEVDTCWTQCELPSVGGNRKVCQAHTQAPSGVPATSSLTGVNTNVSVNPPPRNPECPPALDGGLQGARYPWGGLNAGARVLTCNGCPAGRPTFQGKWRKHGFAEDGTTPDLSVGSDLSSDAEVLYVDGNTWYRRQYDEETRTFVEVRGWYMCSQQPEHPNEHLFWKVIKAEPDGALGIATCDVLETDVVLPTGQYRILVAWYKQLGATMASQSGYCKVGSEEFPGEPCNDPFD